MIGDAEMLDFLIAKNTNELGPQVQKVLNEVASGDYESRCSTFPELKAYVYGVLPLGHLDKLPLHSNGFSVMIINSLKIPACFNTKCPLKLPFHFHLFLPYLFLFTVHLNDSSVITIEQLQYSI